MKRQRETHLGNQTNKSSIFLAQAKKSSIPPCSPGRIWCSKQEDWVREMDSSLFSLGSQCRRWDCQFHWEQQEKLLGISNGLSVFWQWAQQLVCQFLTKCKNNDNPLRSLWSALAPFNWGPETTSIGLCTFDPPTFNPKINPLYTRS
jgi:hypothetical protein